jgi:hypothetical protein
MPRDFITLADVREPTLTLVCEPCGRRGRYNFHRLIAAHGADMRPPELLTTRANCEKVRSGRHPRRRCKAVYGGFSFHVVPVIAEQRRPCSRQCWSAAAKVIADWTAFLAEEKGSAEPRALKPVRAKSDQPPRFYLGALEAVCDTRSHFPSRFSKTSVSNVGALNEDPDLSFPSAFTMPMDQATSPFT